MIPGSWPTCDRWSMRPSRRFVRTRWNTAPDSPAVRRCCGCPSANGDNPFAPLRMLAYRGIYTKVVPWERQYPIEDFASPFIDAASVGFLMREGPPLDAGILGAARWQRIEIPS